jgi:asparagine synthase (glutamine-hydrolysing)
MSIIFGIRQAEGQAVETRQVLDLADDTKRYALDGTSVRAKNRIGMGFQPNHSHQRSILESQPVVDERNNMLTLDGRLDNHKELCELIGIQDCDTPDSLIVLAAFARWGEGCFSRFVGDWALALWWHEDRSLYLARDHAGTRTLYFQMCHDRVVWATHLETFFSLQGAYELDRNYAVTYLSGQITRHRTPYLGISSVMPAQYVLVKERSIVLKSHWEPNAGYSIKYKTDREYEEHFLALFEQAVERRTGLNDPVLCELSGGMDSSSIVCMSDRIRRKIPAVDIVDTVSYYDNSEPGWDEKAYFTLMEAKRGKWGIHLESSFRSRTFNPPDIVRAIYLLPGADGDSIEREAKFSAAIRGRDYRVIISGIGGDELMGGVPTPTPELADYLISLQLTTLFTRGLQWCCSTRTPFAKAIFDTVRFSLNLYCAPKLAGGPAPPPWIQADLTKELRDRVSATGYDAMITRLRKSPAELNAANVWAVLTETLPHKDPRFSARLEYRYPYLDRQLVTYLFSIPRDQLLRPGERRSLMRRALGDILPAEILARRRKASPNRGPLVSLWEKSERLHELFCLARAEDLQLINSKNLLKALDETVRTADTKLWAHIMRAISFELWLLANDHRLTYGNQ